MAGRRQFEDEAVRIAAEQVFRRRGYLAASVHEIATAAGVQRGSLYHAFGDKEDIFLWAYGAYRGRFLTAAEAALDGNDLRASLIRFFDMAITNMAAPEGGCLTTRTLQEGAGAGPRVSAEARSLLERLEQLLVCAFVRAARPAPLPPHAAARMVVTVTRGLAVMERAGSTKAQLASTARHLIDLIAPPAARG